MRRVIALITVFLVAFAFGACQADAEPEYVPEPEPAEEEPIVTEPVAPEINDGYYIKYPEKYMLFDFAEFPEEHFLRGAWTIARLTEMYGEPNDVSIFKDLFGASAVLIGLKFYLYSILLNEPDVELFSFTSDDIAAGEAVLDENDKSLEIEIQQFTVYDADIELPHGFMIGVSTKEDILKAYPEGTAMIYVNEESNSDLISFYYTFPDEDGVLPEWGNAAVVGGVQYNFDKNEILIHVDLMYNY